MGKVALKTPTFPMRAKDKSTTTTYNMATTKPLQEQDMATCGEILRKKAQGMSITKISQGSSPKPPAPTIKRNFNARLVNIVSFVVV